MGKHLASAGLIPLLFVSACTAQPPSGQVRLLSLNPPLASTVREGGFSDLTPDPSDPSGRTWFSISDRGPNEAKDGIALFRWPGYHQKISRWRLDENGSIRVLSFDSIRDSQGRWTNGLPSPLFPFTERAFVVDAQTGGHAPREADSAGFDFEGIANDGKDGFWASEEYGPRIVHMRRDSSGFRIDRELSPGAGLPRVFTRRAVNKGLEALCSTPGGRIIAAFQGALDNATEAGLGDIAERSLARRILVLDPSNGSLREFMEQVNDDPDGKTSRRTKTGACAALDENQVLLLQHRKTGKGAVQVDLVRVDLASADDVHLAVDTLWRGRLVGGRTLEEVALKRGGLAKAGIRTAARSVVMSDLTAAVGGRIPKPEGLVLVADSGFVVVFDNDFGIEGGGETSLFLLGRLPQGGVVRGE